jgi:hypothetical protein
MPRFMLRPGLAAGPHRGELQPEPRHEPLELPQVALVILFVAVHEVADDGDLVGGPLDLARNGHGTREGVEHLRVPVHPVAIDRPIHHVEGVGAGGRLGLPHEPLVVDPHDGGHRHGGHEDEPGAFELAHLREPRDYLLVAFVDDLPAVQGGVADAMVAADAHQSGHPVVVAVDELRF